MYKYVMPENSEMQFTVLALSVERIYLLQHFLLVERYYIVP